MITTIPQKKSLYSLVLESMVRSLLRVLQRSWLKDTDLVLIRSSYFTRIRAAVQRRDANIIVYGSWDDLHPLEVARQYHNVASCSVCLDWIKADSLISRSTSVTFSLSMGTANA